MSTAISLGQYALPTRDNSQHSAASASGTKPSIVLQDPRSQALKPEPDLKPMHDKVLRLWEDFEGTAYEGVRNDILADWKSSDGPQREFLTRAVELLAEFQKQPMKTMMDSLKWSKYLETAKIEPRKYLAWAQNQYEQLEVNKRKFFDISLETLSGCLSKADWKTANDDSAIFNAYLLNADLNTKPDFYLGPYRQLDSHLALRLNSRCLTPPNVDHHTARFYGVTAINPNILLSLRYVRLTSKTKRENLFIPLGEFINSCPLLYTLATC
jgi:hypothetical protein